MSWLDDVLAETSQLKLRARVQRKYGGFPEWEEYFQTAISKLWEKLKHYNDADVTQSLLHKTFDNLVIDSHRKLYRYSRPRKWLQNYGTLGTDIFKLKCINGSNNSFVINTLAESFRKKGLPESSIEAELELAEAIVSKIDAIDDCNYGRHDRVAVDEIDRSEALSDSEHVGGFTDPVASMESMEVDVLMEFIFTGEQVGGASMASFDNLIEIAKTQHLSNEQRLILQLSYREGHTDLAGAEVLNMKPHTYRRRRESALSVLKELFDQ